MGTVLGGLFGLTVAGPQGCLPAGSAMPPLHVFWVSLRAGLSLIWLQVASLRVLGRRVSVLSEDSEEICFETPLLSQGKWQCGCA